MYAVIKTGGKQYKISEGETVRVEKLPGEAGDDVTLDSVLMVSGDEGVTIGRPFVESASVTAKIVAQARHPKIRVLHWKRRKGYKKLSGHRQPYTELKITGINS